MDFFLNKLKKKNKQKTKKHLFNSKLPQNQAKSHMREKNDRILYVWVLWNVKLIVNSRARVFFKPCYLVLAGTETMPAVSLIVLPAFCSESLQEQDHTTFIGFLPCCSCSSFTVVPAWIGSVLNVDPILCPTEVLLSYLCHWTEIWCRSRSSPKAFIFLFPNPEVNRFLLL